MAKAIYEKRTFNNPKTGEIIQYDWYGIKGINSNGKAKELNLTKLMDANNKIAFEVLAECHDPIDESNTNVETRKANEEEQKQFQSNIKKDGKTILDDDEDDGLGGLFK